jgi:type VI secretion system secreted protein VgrG
MANVKAAVDFVMRQEDSSLKGVITDAPSDRGGETRFGIAAKWHPELANTGFFSASMSPQEAFPIAENAYETQYVPALHLDALKSDAVATALLSFGVLEGTAEAITILQNAIVMLGLPIDVDGKMGPSTVAAANSCDPQKLVTAIVQLQKAHFAHIAAVNPTQAVWVHGWDNRADLLLSIAG